MRTPRHIRESLLADDRIWRLPADVVIMPVRELPEKVLNELSPSGEISLDQYCVERENARTLPKVINKNVADVLNLFGHNGAVYKAVLTSFAKSQGLDCDKVDEELKPLVATLIGSNLLIDAAAESDTTGTVKAGFTSGDLWCDYRIIDEIKTMIDTEIYKVEKIQDGAIRALKIMPASFPNPEMRKTITRRLKHEFAVLDAIDHPYVVTLRETGTHEGRVYGVLDYADGPPVRSYVHADDKKPDDATLLEYAIQCVTALEAVHDAGFLHGDVHTANFLIKDDQVCLIDFGLSRPINLSKREEKKYHQGGVIPYMPPEYVRGLEDKKRRLWGSVSTEIYSCAVVIYSLFTRKYPYEWTTYRKDYVQKILNDPPRSFEACERRPWPELETVLRCALAKHSGERYQSMSDFREALEGIAASAAKGIYPFYGKAEPIATDAGKERA